MELDPFLSFLLDHPSFFKFNGWLTHKEKNKTRERKKTCGLNGWD